MNKKILSIFVMVMALSLLGVSCNKKTTDPTNNGGSSSNPTTLTESDLEAWLKSIPATEAVDSAVFTFASGTFGSGTLSVESTGASAEVTVANVKNNVITSLQAADQSKFKITTTIDTSIFSGGDTGGATALVATFAIEPASDSYVFDSNVDAVKAQVKLSLTVNGGNNWK